MSDAPDVLPADETRDRSNGGQFRPGNLGGPGNPFARQVAALRKLVLTAITEDRMRQLIEMIFERAINGDMAAAKVLLQYSLGKPAAAVDPDRIEVDELKLREESAIPYARVLDFKGRLSAENVNIIADHLWPVSQSRLIHPMLERLDRRDRIEERREARRAKKMARREMLRRGLPMPSTNGSNGAAGKKTLRDGG
jgi:hypothetical protein